MSRAKPKRRVRVVRHFKILERLDPVHHDALVARLRRRGRKMKAIAQWLADLGCRVPLGTVCRYRDHLLAEDDRRRALDSAAFREAERAVSYARIAKWHDAPDFTPGAVTLCQLLATVSIVLLRYEPDTTAHELRRYFDALDALFKVCYAGYGRKRESLN